MTRVQQVGDQIEELLAGLAASGQGAAAEELVRLLVGLYGDGLARIAGTLSDEGAAGAARSPSPSPSSSARAVWRPRPCPAR